MRLTLSILILFLLGGAQEKQTPQILLPGVAPSIDSLQFPMQQYEKLFSYSFNRKGRDELIERFQSLRQQLAKPEIQQDSLRYFELLFTCREMADEVSLGERSIVLDGQIARTAEHISDVTNSEVLDLNEILKIDIPDNAPGNNCIPFYRDGLVFFDPEGEIIAHINICFQCKIISSEPFYNFRLSTAQWKALQDFFELDLKHPMGE